MFNPIEVAVFADRLRDENHFEAKAYARAILGSFPEEFSNVLGIEYTVDQLPTVIDDLLAKLALVGVNEAYAVVIPTIVYIIHQYLESNNDNAASISSQSSDEQSTDGDATR